MALYMVQFNYTTEAWQTLTQKPQDRSVGLSTMVQKAGGRLISLYYCFGEYDGVALLEAPDDIAASAVVLAALTPGYIKTIKTTKLLTIEETIEAMRKAGSLSYQGPSRG